MSAERPAKRIRQACENCRRKKARCPGEKPTCSYCARLGQFCVYADESPVQNQVANVRPRSQMEERMESLETKLAEVIEVVRQSTTPNHPVHGNDSSPMVSSTPAETPSQMPKSKLPPWNDVITAAELYLQYCDCQPLPLFDRGSFISTLETRDPEVLLAMLALSLRFSGDRHIRSNAAEISKGYVETSRAFVIQRMSEGPIELSTLQSLCLLSLIDFTKDGNTQRASVNSTLAMDLAHCAGLTRESKLSLTNTMREERRRCFWSIFLLKRLHGADFTVLDFYGKENFPWYPTTTCKPSLSNARPVSPIDDDPAADEKIDSGIVAYAIQLSEVWFKTTKYGRRRGQESKLPPWSPQSEYATIMAQQMDFETRVPYIHRFKPANFSSKSSEELERNRDYWGPWLFTQFLYHTNLCLLNHPLLLSLRLKTLTLTTVIPEIFLQHTYDLIISHAGWIIHFIDVLEAKSFKVSDPFLGHCAAIVATIHLQESFKQGARQRKEKHLNFAKCLRFIRDIGEQWPHVARIAEKLQRLEDTVSATHQTSPNPETPNRRGLLIDLGLFWEILEYSSATELSSNKLFGATLYQGGRYSDNTEVSNASALPEPTWLDTASRAGSMSHNRDDGPLNGNSGIDGLGFGIEGLPGQEALTYSDNELAVLAESFFQQRNGTIMGTVDEWWNNGNL